MNKRVYKYFTDFDKLKVSRKNNSIILQDNSIVLDLQEDHANTFWHCDLARYILGKHKFYVKQTLGEDGLYGIASSRMYGDLNFITPQVFPVIGENTNEDFIKIGSEDVKSLQGLEIVSPEHVLHEILMLKKQTRHLKPLTMWSALHDSDEKEMFLQVMTEECFDELITLFLVDILRTDSDRHIYNYFFYRRPGSVKFEGIIPIDLEFGDVLFSCCDNKDFNKFLSEYTSAYTPCGHTDKGSCHRDRIKDILGLINTDKLSNKQLATLKQALQYDLPKKIKDMGEHYALNIYADSIYTPISKLWEYNYKNLHSELE